MPDYIFAKKMNMQIRTEFADRDKENPEICNITWAKSR